MTISNPIFSSSKILKPIKLHHANNTQKDSDLALTITAAGIVFGDIGTSPLYALKICFIPGHGIIAGTLEIFGILSLIFWTLTLIVSGKYALFIMRANNRGEGGVLALMALAMRTAKNKTKRSELFFILGVIGACLFYGDTIITPAISVVSAVEGLTIISPQFSVFIIPITITILVGLFLLQKYGTATVGKIFGPIMICWFLVIGMLGIYNIINAPAILKAVNPAYAVTFISTHLLEAFVVLGAIFLVVTGAETLYTDMGHFGIKPIRSAWFFIALPGLLLNYFGQGALLLHNPKAITNPFFLMVPENMTLIIVIFATLVTVIASQAVISGAYSITNQAIMLGILPRMRIIYTSSKEKGQIYIPFINWLLLTLVIITVLSFQTSNNLAAAYGLTVSATMVITTLLAGIVMFKLWQWPILLVFAITCILLIMDISFLSANLLKIVDGGWFPLLLAGIIFFFLMTWYRGRKLFRALTVNVGIPIVEFIEQLLQDPPHRVQGTAIFLSSHIEYVPAAMLHNLKHNQILHERVFFLKISIWDVPYINNHEQITMRDLGNDIYLVRAVFGFKETPDINYILSLLEKQYNMKFNLMKTSFFLARDTIIPSNLPGMWIWREALFAWMYKNAARPSDFFSIPTDRVVEVGAQIEI
jgi:KUP system potassium uptake protein